MTEDRFNELLHGPLHHPSIAFTVSRLALALKHVVDASPEAEKALEAYCAERGAADERAAEAAEFQDDPDAELWGV